MINKKLLVSFMFKDFEILEVSEEIFKNSPNVENVGCMSALKVNSEEDLNFKIKELKNKGFVEVVE